MSEYAHVTTTTDSEEAAATLARGIVEARAGACVQVVPIRSFFRWDNAVQDDQEWQLQIKTAEHQVDTLIDYIKSNHGYDVPEIIITPITGGNSQYLSWVDAEARG